MKAFGFAESFIALIGILISTLISYSYCDHILFLHTWVILSSTYSHRVSSWLLVEALIEKGHQVTFISPYPGLNGTTTNSKVTEIIPSNLTRFMDAITFDNFDVTNRAAGLTPKFIMVYDALCLKACEATLKSKEFQAWLSTKPKVDLVFSDTSTDCGYGVSSKLKSKHALILPLTFISKYFEAFGINPDSSSIPDWDIVYQLPLSFFNRLVGFFIPLGWRLSQVVHFMWYQTLFKNALDLKDDLDLDDVQGNTCFILINGDYIEDYPRSYPPFVVKVPGLHVKSTHKPLDRDLETFINSDNSQGFLLVSFGTVAKASRLPLEIRETFFKSIEAFPEIRFIWRWDGVNPKEYPKNLYLKRWVEQEDLLAHPKVLGFITQAGRPSMQEAFYNGVPTITFHILADQDFNAQRYADLGTSINLDIDGISEVKLKAAISELLTDNRTVPRLKIRLLSDSPTRYRKNSIQLAKLAKDVPMKSVDIALWWTEFALRHTPEELSLLHPLGRKQSWIVRRHLEVWTFIVVCAASSIALFYYGFSVIFIKLFCKNVSTRETIKSKTN